MAGEWTATRLEKVLSFANGKSSPDRIGSGRYPVYGSNGVIGHANEMNSEAGTIVIGRVGSYCGSLYLSKQECWVTDNAIRATAVPGNSARFLFYLLSTLQLHRWRGGSGQPLLNQSILNVIPAFIPSFKEQEAIACILGALDDKIELNRRMNETLEGIARAIFKSWFVDFEPVHANAAGRQSARLASHVAQLFPKAFEGSVLGEIPKGWMAAPIGDLCQIEIGGDWGEDGAFKDAMEVICLRGVDLEHLRETGWADAPRRWVRSSSIAKRQMDDHDVLVAGSGAGPTGRPLWVNPRLGQLWPQPVIYSNFCKRLRCQSPEVAIYLDRWLQTMRESGEIWEYVTGTSVPNLDTSPLLKSKVIPVPDSGILNAFAKIVQSVTERLFSPESQTITSLRDTLLPELISGELRVPDAERIIKRAL